MTELAGLTGWKCGGDCDNWSRQAAKVARRNAYAW
jgi:hypothetical protein